MGDDDLITGGDLVEGALSIASQYVGVKETARNSGPEIDLFLAAVGLRPGYAWCAAFVYFCFMRASAKLGLVNPCPRSARALGVWSLADGACKTQVATRGSLFVLDTGEPGGDGHIGFVEVAHPDGTIDSIEGNTNAAGSREGNAVARKLAWDPRPNRRGRLMGFVDLSRAHLRAVP